MGLIILSSLLITIQLIMLGDLVIKDVFLLRYLDGDNLDKMTVNCCL